MGVRGCVRGARRRRIAVGALLGLAIPMLAVSIAQAKVVPAVPAAGVGTKAALESPQCGDDGKLAYPYPQRLPCTAPLKAGQSNGGATSMGVTKDTIKVVLFLGTHAQQDADRNRPGSSAPIDLATNQPAYFEDSFPPWQEVLGHNFNTWGRELEFVTVNPTGTDEGAQRADALRVAEEEPFAVVVNVPVTAGGGQVFASELVAKKIIVFFGGITNEEADRQAPYRYLGGFDNNASAVNTATFAARQLQGETAKWSGDYTDDKRVFGTVYPDTRHRLAVLREHGQEGRPEGGYQHRVHGAARHQPDDAQGSGGSADDRRQAEGRGRHHGAALHVVPDEPGAAQGRRRPRLPPGVGVHRHGRPGHRGHGADRERHRPRADEARVRARQPAAVRRRHQRPAARLVQLVLGRQPGRVLGGELRHAPPAQRGAELRRPEAHARTRSSRGCSACRCAAAPRASSCRAS